MIKIHATSHVDYVVTTFYTAECDSTEIIIICGDRTAKGGLRKCVCYGEGEQIMCDVRHTYFLFFYHTFKT